MPDPIIAKTPNQVADTVPNANNTAPGTLTAPAPAVVSAKSATDNATQIQQTLNDKTTGATGMATAKQNPGTTYDAQDNMVITGGIKPDGSLYQSTIPKGTAGYVANPATVQAQKDAAVKTAQTTAETNNTNALTAAATGTTPPSTTSTTPADLQSQIEQYNQDPEGFAQWATDKGLTNIQADDVKYQASIQKLNGISADYNNKLTQLANGTYPLTADQNAALSALQQQWELTIQSQMAANETYKNAAGMAVARAGGEYDPMGATATVQRAMDTGINAIKSEQAAETEALANMRQGFMDNNFKAVTTAYNSMIQNDKNITDTLKGIYDTAVTAQQQTFDNAEKIKSDTAKQILDDHTMSIQDKQFSLDQLKFDEQKRKDYQDELISQESALKGTYQIKDNSDGTQSIFNTKTGQVTGSPMNSIIGGQFTDNQGGTMSPGNTGIPLLDSNTKKTITGVFYVDGTNMTKTQQESISKEAANLGIPYIGKDGADALANVDTARTNMENISNTLKNVSPSNAFTRPFAAVGNTIAGVLQTNDSISSFNAYRSAAIQSLRAMAGSKGLRINAAEIQTAMDNDIPKVNDTYATAQAKIEKVNSMLDSQERGLFGQNYDIMKIEGTTSSPTETLKKIGALDSKYQTQIQQIHNQFPNYTDDEILQIFNPNAK